MLGCAQLIRDHFKSNQCNLSEDTFALYTSAEVRHTDCIILIQEIRCLYDIPMCVPRGMENEKMCDHVTRVPSRDLDEEELWRPRVHSSAIDHVTHHVTGLTTQQHTGRVKQASQRHGPTSLCRSLFSSDCHLLWTQNDQSAAQREDGRPRFGLGSRRLSVVPHRVPSEERRA